MKINECFVRKIKNDLCACFVHFVTFGGKVFVKRALCANQSVLVFLHVTTFKKGGGGAQKRALIQKLLWKLVCKLTSDFLAYFYTLGWDPHLT